MFGSQLLEIAIGLVFIFLLFSLICSGANELLSSMFNARGDFLRKGLTELLNDAGGVNGLVSKIYNHGLIFGLYRGEYDPGKWKNLPSYIPSRSFALALMDALPRMAAPQPAAVKEEDGKAPEVAEAAGAPLSGAQGAMAWGGAQKDPEASQLKAFRDAVARFPDQKVSHPLLTLIDAANGDASKARQNIEDWYNGTMDRVSGWYKTRSQWILLSLGVGVALFFNADTLSMTRQLSNDMVMRQSLVAAAQERAKNHASEEANGDLKQNLQAIRKLGLPVGWVEEEPGVDRLRVLPHWSTPSAYLWTWVWIVRTHVLGWLLTAVAISLGAPFWFDLLNRFMVVRSTVKPEEKSKTEGSKD